MRKKNEDIYHEETEVKENEIATSQEVDKFMPHIESGVEMVDMEPNLGKVVCNEHLNIREAPSTTATIKGIIPRGAIVVIDSEDDKDFYKIVTEAGLDGYAMKKFIEKV